ncbi:MAG: glycosyltransferase family 4 protein, partial [Sphingomonadaceae bacterium]
RPEAGRLVPADAGAETIAAAARELLADPPAQRKVREAAKKFSWEANAKTLRAHLAAVARS